MAESCVVPELPQPNTSNLTRVLEIVEEAAQLPPQRDGLAFALMDKVCGSRQIAPCGRTR